VLRILILEKDSTIPVLILEGINEMPNSDWKLVNTGKKESYELEHWLEKKEYSTSGENFKKLTKTIETKIKEDHSEKVIQWSELDSALENHPSWFSDLAPMVHKK
jgi:hypothetical protein